ncbi:DEAD-box ATP-dependent RNA helicase DeaD (= CshA), partial [hydrothermal vent metagenome]
ATSEDKVFQIAFNHMVNPKIVRIKQSEAEKAKIKEMFHMVHPSERMDALFEAIRHESEGQTLVFCRTKREVDSVAERLLSKGLSVEAIHGDFRQVRRDKVMKNYKDGKTEILVATDVAARGIHVENITTVINYSLPDDPTVYVHRIGRTGRVGKTGVAISLYTIDQKYTLNDYRTRASAAFQAGAY